MSLNELARKYNLHYNYFHTLSKAKKDYIFSFDDNKEKSIQMYVNHVVSIRHNVQNMFLNPKYRRNIGLWLEDINYLPNSKYNSIRVNSFERVLYMIVDNPIQTNWNSIQKLEFLYNKGVEHGLINNYSLSDNGDSIS